MIEKILLQTHITALKTIEPCYLLEGSGGFLNYYDLQQNEVLESLDLFHGARIHGIQKFPGASEVVVFGGKFLAVVEVHDPSIGDTSKKLKVKAKWEECDWIRDAKFINNCNYLAVLTSHNRVLVHEVASKTARAEIVGSEQCILYSGKILGDCHTQLTILSGTVFGEILIWAASPFNKFSQLFHRLSGHSGVIFSVSYDRISQTIISTSDDRTIRTWSLVPKDQTAHAVRAGLCCDWDVFEQSQVVAKHELYGHEARVWNNIVIRTEQRQDDLGRIVSLGEDSRICVWDLATGKLVSKLEAHPGASVWTADWNHHLSALVTGGGDGATRIWNASQLEEVPCYRLQLPGDDLQVPRLVVIATGFLTLTHQGAIYGRKPEAEEWIKLFQDDRLSPGSVMDFSGEILVFGTCSGAVFLFSCSVGPSLELLNIKQLEQSKIYSVLLVGTDDLLVSFDRGRIELLCLKRRHDPQLSARFVLPEGKQRWPSCALITQAALIVGDRDGSLHLYAREQQDPLQSFKNIHGKNGLTDVRADPIDHNLYYTAGKDGRVGLWRLNDQQTALELLSVTNTSLGWIARLCWINQELIYLAFHSDRFVVWSSQQQRSLMQVPCGGGHRSWDFDVSSDHVTFLFIKDRQIYETRCLLSKVFRPTLPGRCGGHSKSVCRARFLSIRGEPIILTGSEDTMIRLSRLSDGSVRCLTTIPKHVSSVRALAVKALRDAENTWLCVSAGGRAQLSVGLLTSPTSHSSPSMYVIYRDFKTHFLRGWIHRASSKPWLAGRDASLVVPDPETRFMDVDILDVEDHHFLVFAACSDGFVRIYDVELDSRQLELIQELDFHHCCVLQVKVVKENASTGPNRALLLSAGTNGRLAVWDVTTCCQESSDDQLQPMGCLSLHQSGINSLDCKWISNVSDSKQSRLVILTGGDDNALVLTHVDVDWAEQSLRLAGPQHRQHPHSAQISGVALLERDLAVSVSLDQRFILWRVVEGIRLTWLNATCCDVSDIQGLHVLNTSSSDQPKNVALVTVFGQGFQTIRISEP